MKLLLDSHVLVWLAGDSGRPSAAIRNIIAEPDNSVHVSLASAWELAIKQAKGKLAFDAMSLVEDLPASVQRLPITADHIFATRTLPHHHGDPFDRLLIAQAKVEGLTIITHDDAFRPYGVPILWT